MVDQVRMGYADFSGNGGQGDGVRPPPKARESGLTPEPHDGLPQANGDGDAAFPFFQSMPIKVTFV